jgi:hypothetical protein
MKRRSKLATVAATAAAAWALTVMPAAAITYEHDHTDSDSGGYSHSFDACRVTSYAQGCFAGYGEWFSVDDYAADGKSPVVRWELYDRDNAGDFTVKTRHGAIFHSMGAGKLGWQDKTFTDGLRLRFQLCLGDHDTHTVSSSTCTSWVYTAA